MSVEEQMAVLNLKQIQAQKMKIQEAEMAALPKSISVTYIASEGYYSHRGRSRAAKRDPYRFNQNVPVEITILEDVKYFLFLGKTNPKMWKVDSGIDAKKVLDQEKAKEVESKKKGLAKKKAQAKKARDARAAKKKPKTAREKGLDAAEAQTKANKLKKLEDEIEDEENTQILEDAKKTKIPKEVIEANKKAQEAHNKAVEGVDE